MKDVILRFLMFGKVNFIKKNLFEQYYLLKIEVINLRMI